MKRRVLVFTVDLVPVSGMPLYGGGLRAWGLGQGLTAAGHDVIYSVPAALLEGRKEVPRALADHAFSGGNLQDVINKTDPDVLLFEQWGLLEYLHDDGLPTVIDLHGSLILENSYRGQLNWSVNAEAKIRALRKADLVVVPGLRQSDYFKPWLMLAGQNPRTLPIAVIPVSLSPELPRRKKPSAKEKDTGESVLVFGGNLWPWIDPLPALDVVTRVMERKKKGRLHLFVGHPQRSSGLPQEPAVGAPATRLDAVMTHERSVQRGFISHDRLMAEYLSAAAAVDVYRRNAERELAVTTRTIEYMWCGLPVIYGNYGELSAAIGGAEAGWLVDPEDETAIDRAVEQILDEPAVVRQRSENARKLVADRFTWDRTIAPLDAFCREPVKRGKGRPIFAQLSAEFEGLRRQWDGQREQLQNLGAEQASETARLGREYDELKKAYEAFHRELRVKQEELTRALQKLDSETAWRDEEIRRLSKEKTSELKQRDDDLRRLEREKADECKWRDDELRRREALAQEKEARSQADLAARDEKLEKLGQEMTELVRRKDARFEALEARMQEDVRARDETLRLRDEEIRALNVERARDVRDLSDELRQRDLKINTLNEERHRLLQKSEELKRVTMEFAELRERHDREGQEAAAERGRLAAELAVANPEVVRLQGLLAEIIAERDGLGLQSLDRLNDITRLEFELEDTRASDRREMDRIEAERVKMEELFQGSEARVQEATAERDDLRGQVAALNNLLNKQTVSWNVERQALQAAVEEHRLAAAGVREECDGQRSHAANLQLLVDTQTRRVQWLEGVVASMKNRAPHKLYKFTTHWVRRVVLQVPLLAGLYAMNLVSNLYMQWWTRRHRQQVFPGM